MSNSFYLPNSGLFVNRFVEEFLINMIKKGFNQMTIEKLFSQFK